MLVFLLEVFLNIIRRQALINEIAKLKKKLSKLSESHLEIRFKMERNQRTIRTSQSCEGIGLHTGVETVITFHPAPEDFEFVLLDLISQIVWK